MKRISVLLAEDHTIVRQGMRLLIEADGDIEIVGQAKTGREAIQLTKDLRPDVIVMDIAMPILNGLQATRQILKAFPETKILILSAYNDPEYVKQVVKSGALGYLLKQSSAEIVGTAIRELHKGRGFFSQSITKRLQDDYQKSDNRLLRFGAVRRPMSCWPNKLFLTGPGATGRRGAANIPPRWKANNMDHLPLYPLRFKPIYQYRLWGGRRLADLLSAPLPGEGPIGEAWLLSDRADHPSLVTEGPLKGKTIADLMKQSPKEILGSLAGHYARFPLLLKFLDVTKGLSVQVHPSDALKELIPAGDTGKTEAWVVLEKGPDARVYAGLKPGTTPDNLRQAIAKGTVEDRLSSFVPCPGDGVFIRAGTVHSLRDLVVFEVQENSDVTFRLYDWNHIDPRTGQLRQLQVDQAMACINFDQGVIGPVTAQFNAAKPLPWENLINCDHFGVWRASTEFPFLVGAAETCRVLVGLEGRGHLEYDGVDYPFDQGEVLLLPAAVGACRCQPNGNVTVLEISLPEISWSREKLIVSDLDGTQARSQH